MARRKQTADPALPDWPPGLIDQLAAGVKTPADFQQVYRAFQKALTEKGLQAERTHHLGYPVREGRAPDGNARNGTTPKRVATDTGTLDLAIPRDRDSAFAPQFVPKGVRRLPGFDETVLALYARGLTTRELQGYLEERYQVAVSPDLIRTASATFPGCMFFRCYGSTEMVTATLGIRDHVDVGAMAAMRQLARHLV